MLRAACLVGDQYHEPTAIEGPLRAVFDARGVAGSFFEEPASFPWTGLGDYDLVTVAKEGRARPKVSEERWSRAADEEALASYVEAGGRLLVLHNGLASYDPEGAYARLARGRFLFHPVEHPRFQIRVVAEGSALDGSEFFEIEDEMYFVYVDSALTEVVLRSFSADYGSSAAAWRHRVGAGRVFCLTPGHGAAVLADPSYRAVLQGALTWLFGR
jgi:type 1 glutamine amidotransferase